MSRAFVRTLLGALAVAGVVPFVVPLRDGKPLLDYRTLRAPALPDVALPDFGSGGAATPVAVYKWRGPDGEWQFGNTLPAPGTTYEVVTIDPNANLIQAPPPTADPAAAPTAPPMGNPLDAYSPAKVQQNLDQARAARSAMDQRGAAQQAIIDGR